MPLPKQNRLVHKKDIQNVLRGKYLDTLEFRFRAKPNTLNKFRLLVTVSKKVSKKANQRNRIRRKINHYFETWFKQKTLPNNLDMMIVVKKNILQTLDNFSGLEEILKTKTVELFEKLK